MSRYKKTTEEDLPVVDKPGAFKMPKKFVDRRGQSNRPSVWGEFLKDLEVGSSFVVKSYATRQLVRKYAREYDIDIVDVVLEKTYHTYRMWIYGKPGERNPLYAKSGGKTFKLEEVVEED